MGTYQKFGGAFFSYTIHIWIVCVVCIVCCERDIYIHHVYTYELGGTPS